MKKLTIITLLINLILCLGLIIIAFQLSNYNQSLKKVETFEKSYCSLNFFVKTQKGEWIEIKKIKVNDYKKNKSKYRINTWCLVNDIY